MEVLDSSSLMLCCVNFTSDASFLSALGLVPRESPLVLRVHRVCGVRMNGLVQVILVQMYVLRLQLGIGWKTC